MTIPAAPSSPGPSPGPLGLPSWDRVLAVVAHPDDESFGLGAVLSTLAAAGADPAGAGPTGSVVDVLCLTRGEASTLRGGGEEGADGVKNDGVGGDLAQIRELELRAAADALGVRSVDLRDLPDGGLSALEETVLDDEVGRGVTASRPDAIITLDTTGISGHPDHIAATGAAVRVAARRGLPVLAWTLSDEICETLASEGFAGFLGRPAEEVDLILTVDRRAQLEAINCHRSQAVPGSVLWRRLELQGDTEHLRWLNRT